MAYDPGSNNSSSVMLPPAEEDEGDGQDFFNTKFSVWANFYLDHKLTTCTCDVREQLSSNACFKRMPPLTIIIPGILIKTLRHQ